MLIRVLIEAVGADVVEDGGIEDGLVGLVAVSPDGGANFGGGDIFGEIGKQIEVGAACSAREGKDEAVVFVPGFRAILGIVGDTDGDGIGKSGGDTGEIETRTGSDDEVAGNEQLGGATPFGDGEEGVGSHEAVEAVVRRERGAQSGNGVDGVVGLVVRTRSVDEGQGELWMAGDGEAHHGDAVGKAGGGEIMLQRLHSDGGDEHLIEVETVEGQARERQMATVRRIEATTKKSDVHAPLILPGTREWRST